jgi:hypothetical protein
MEGVGGDGGDSVAGRRVNLMGGTHCMLRSWLDPGERTRLHAGQRRPAFGSSSQPTMQTIFSAGGREREAESERPLGE